MYTSVVVVCAVTSAAALSFQHLAPPEQALSKSRTELRPIETHCNLGDVLVIAAPIILGDDVKYYLYDPRGDFRRLDIKIRTPVNISLPHDEKLSMKFYKDQAAMVTSWFKYHVFDVNAAYYTITKGSMAMVKDELDVFERYRKKMKPNDFMLGPVGVSDYGNWVLSAYYKDSTGTWTEVNQPLSIKIREWVLAKKKVYKIKEGDTFEPRFRSIFPSIKSCELVGAVDRNRAFEQVTLVDMATCHFAVRNVSKRSEGIWTMGATGLISYESAFRLEVIK